MMRHLTTLVLAGVLGTFLMSGNAEACHKKTCRHAAPVACAPAPVVCAPAPVVYAPPAPAPCAKPVKMACAPKVKKCGGGGLFHHKKTVTAGCATQVSYATTVSYSATASYSSVVPSGQYMGSPQGSYQR